MRFLVDAQLPPALARLLSQHGHTAEHVTDIGPGEMPDSELSRYALEHHAVFVTKDEDFSNMVLLGVPMPVIVWVRAGNTRRRALLDWFELLLDQVVERIEAGDRLIELR